jgi:hypothetical protein
MSTEPKKLKIRKNVNSRTRSPASQSPASKSRKATTTTAAVATATGKSFSKELRNPATLENHSPTILTCIFLEIWQCHPNSCYPNIRNI